MRIADSARRAWRKPPSQFHRWLAAHPFLWVGIVVAVIGVPALQSPPNDGLVVAIYGAGLLAVGLAALGGALLTRRKVTRYDAHASEGR